MGEKRLKVLIAAACNCESSDVSRFVYDLMGEKKIPYEVEHAFSASEACDFVVGTKEDGIPFDLVVVDNRLYMSSSLIGIFGNKGRDVVRFGIYDFEEEIVALSQFLISFLKKSKVVSMDFPRKVKMETAA